MSRITVIGGTGHAGSAIVAEAAASGHRVAAPSRSLPDTPIPNVTHVQDDATDEATLSAAIEGADVVVAALAPRGPPAAGFRDVHRTIARPADAAGIPLFVVVGYSSLRPAPGADRFVTRPRPHPAELHDEIRAGAALVIDDLPATPATLDRVFVSPALGFGARMLNDSPLSARRRRRGPARGRRRDLRRGLRLRVCRPDRERRPPQDTGQPRPLSGQRPLCWTGSTTGDISAAPRHRLAPQRPKPAHLRTGRPCSRSPRRARPGPESTRRLAPDRVLHPGRCGFASGLRAEVAVRVATLRG
ncbi:NAD(P)-dependent oxidoreductase [Embleya sp. NPDC127516]|uniref:NAD(P)-dependent oxidoreductase n=1 Tax=Embleya sp. NPDC127516 TaxID=3363990 RepID=UPI00381C2C2A